MKISCEHCGTQIDVEKDRNCPHCGAPYSRNKEYDEIKNYKKKKEDLNIESHELQNKIVETTLNNFNRVSYFFSNCILSNIYNSNNIYNETLKNRV